MLTRNLRADEKLPSRFDNGFADFKLDPQWVWVAEYGGQLVGIAVAAPTHGIAFLLRLIAAPYAPKSTTLKLLRQMLGDVRARGFKVVMTFLSGEPTELKLARIAAKAGAGFIPCEGAWMALDLTNAKAKPLCHS